MMLGKEHHHRKEFKCPWCKHVMDWSIGAGNDTQTKPQAGDVTICIECAKPGIWLGSAELRRPTYEEAQTLLQREDIIFLMLAIKTMHEIEKSKCK